jgi:CxxC-x17-CxxC domain-containing protein
MKNFQPGGLRNRKPDLGGRPASDAGNYAPKKRFAGGKPSFGSKPGYGNKPSFGADRDKKDVTLYNATCTTCGKSCEVPFRPDGKKPVLCRDCFAAKNDSPTNSANNRERFTTNEMVGRAPERTFAPKQAYPNVSQAEFSTMSKQLISLEAKVAEIIALLKTTPVAKLAPVVSDPVIGDVPAIDVLATPAKVRKPKKVTPAITKAAAKKKVAKKASVAKKVAKVAKKAAK